MSDYPDWWDEYPNLVGPFMMLVVMAFGVCLFGALYLTAKMGNEMEASRPHHRGARCQVTGSDVIVTLLGNHGYTWVCRVDNGAGTAPRFSTAKFRQEELRPIDAAVEP
jgi:hypothetical protein